MTTAGLQQPRPFAAEMKRLISGNSLASNSGAKYFDISRYRSLRASYRAGNVPFGYRLEDDGRTLAPHVAEQKATVEIHKLRRAGKPLRVASLFGKPHGPGTGEDAGSA